MGLIRLRSHGIRQLECNLLDALCILALVFAGRHETSLDWRAAELMVLLGTVTLFLAVHRRHPMRHPSDNTLLNLAATGIFLVGVFSYLFPIDLFHIPWRSSWLQFRYWVLPHWTDFWWFRWGIVAALAVMLAALLVHRAKRSDA